MRNKINVMIARTWHGRTKAEDAAAYREYIAKSSIGVLTSTPGNRGVQVWQRTEGSITHIWVISWWDDRESIRAFSGEDMEKARYFEEDHEYLLEFEPHVQHFEAYDFR